MVKKAKVNCWKLLYKYVCYPKIYLGKFERRDNGEDATPLELECYPNAVPNGCKKDATFKFQAKVKDFNPLSTLQTR